MQSMTVGGPLFPESNLSVEFTDNGIVPRKRKRLLSCTESISSTELQESSKPARRKHYQSTESISSSELNEPATLTNNQRYDSMESISSTELNTSNDKRKRGTLSPQSVSSTDLNDMVMAAPTKSNNSSSVPPKKNNDDSSQKKTEASGSSRNSSSNVGKSDRMGNESSSRNSSTAKPDSKSSASASKSSQSSTREKEKSSSSTNRSHQQSDKNKTSGGQSSSSKPDYPRSGDRKTEHSSSSSGKRDSRDATTSSKKSTSSGSYSKWDPVNKAEEHDRMLERKAADDINERIKALKAEIEREKANMRAERNLEETRHQSRNKSPHEDMNRRHLSPSPPVDMRPLSPGCDARRPALERLGPPPSPWQTDRRLSPSPSPRDTRRPIDLRLGPSPVLMRPDDQRYTPSPPRDARLPVELRLGPSPVHGSQRGARPTGASHRSISRSRSRSRHRQQRSRSRSKHWRRSSRSRSRGSTSRKRRFPSPPSPRRRASSHSRSKQRRSRSRTSPVGRHHSKKPSPSPKRKSRSNSKDSTHSFDLLWPSSPQQPVTDNGRPGSLSPSSKRHTTPRGLPWLTAQRTTNKPPIKRPTVIDSSTSILSKERIITRNIELAKRMNPVVGCDWGERTIEDFKIMNKIGKGTFGQMYKALDRKVDFLVAMKKIALDDNGEGFPVGAFREIKLLTELSHPNIVCLVEIVKNNLFSGASKAYYDGAYFFVYEYFEHDLKGLMESKLVTITLDHTAWVMRQLLEGLNYCHEQKIFHHDLKSSNVIINNRSENL